jgi:hypothetical protein
LIRPVEELGMDATAAIVGTVTTPTATAAMAIADLRLAVACPSDRVFIKDSF